MLTCTLHLKPYLGSKYTYLLAWKQEHFSLLGLHISSHPFECVKVTLGSIKLILKMYIEIISELLLWVHFYVEREEA